MTITATQEIIKGMLLLSVRMEGEVASSKTFAVVGVTVGIKLVGTAGMLPPESVVEQSV